MKWIFEKIGTITIFSKNNKKIDKKKPSIEFIILNSIKN